MEVTDCRGYCLRAVRGEAHGAAAIRAMLTPVSWVVGGVTRVRRWAYRAGVISAARAAVPVISVGNVTTGGTGKTPMVEWIVRRLVGSGRKPAILSRGYRAPPGTGKNDEALVLDRALPDVKHYADADRVRAAREAAAAGADCLVLDDGFQHLRLHRDLNLVLIDALNPFGGGKVLPAGTLREPLTCLADAQAIVVTRADALDEAALAGLRARLQRLAPGKPVCEAIHKASSVADPNGAAGEPADRLAGKRVYLFCGIGNPSGFRATVERLGAVIVGGRFLPDHFHYGTADLAQLAEECHASGAELALTTEKDAVKIRDAWPSPVPLRVLSVEIAFRSGQDELERLLQAALTR
jgi:tetraacyldisaccharide 4'-kinase